jgi:lipoate synthase
LNKRERIAVGLETDEKNIISAIEKLNEKEIKILSLEKYIKK